MTVKRSPDGRRCWLYGDELGGTDRVSFNLYPLSDVPALRACEMTTEKVIAFVLGYGSDLSFDGATRDQRIGASVFTPASASSSPAGGATARSR